MWKFPRVYISTLNNTFQTNTLFRGYWKTIYCTFVKIKDHSLTFYLYHEFHVYQNLHSAKLPISSNNILMFRWFVISKTNIIIVRHIFL